MSDISSMDANPGKEPVVDLPPLQEWNGGKEEPVTREEELQRQLGPQYNGRDKGEPLKKDDLGPNPISE